MSGTQCGTSFASYESLALGTSSQSAGCTESDPSWGSASAYGTLSFSYPLQVSSADPGTFTAQSNANYNWSLGRGRHRQLTAEAEGELFDFSPDCSIPERRTEEGGPGAPRA